MLSRATLRSGYSGRCIVLVFFDNPESEFNEFEPRLKSAKNRFPIERRPKSWNIEYNFKWNQPYFSHVSNLSRGSNFLNSAYVFITYITFVTNSVLL